MANDPITGKDGNVKKDGNQLCHITKFTINDFIDFVKFQSNCTAGATGKIPTFDDWNGSFEFATEDGKCPDFRPGDYFDLTANTAEGVAGKGCTYTGNILVTAMPVDVTIDGANDLVKWNVTFEGNGILTPTDNP